MNEMDRELLKALADFILLKYEQRYEIEEYERVNERKHYGYRHDPWEEDFLDLYKDLKELRDEYKD